MKFRNRQLKFLKPDSNGKVLIKSSKECNAKFIGLITYEKALTHVREGGAIVLDRNTIIKLHSAKQLKRHIRERDNYTCHYCGKYGNTVDHKIPRSKGGCSTPMNLVCCCKECNENKLTKDYQDFINEIKGN